MQPPVVDLGSFRPGWARVNRPATLDTGGDGQMTTPWALTRRQVRCMTRGMLIFKIFRRPEWNALVAAGESAGAPVDLADGYIHFSTAAQVAETAADRKSVV